MTIDVDSARADIPGCTNISDDPAWWRHRADALVPCSSSGLLTEGRVAELGSKSVVGATNLPFATAQALTAAEARGIRFVPEGVSSAGAVIVDSIEFYDNGAFSSAEPQRLYDFTRQVVREKTNQLLVNAKRLNVPASLVVPLVAEGQEAIGHTPVGMRFSKWLTDESSREALDDPDQVKHTRASASSPFIAAQIARATSPVANLAATTMALDTPPKHPSSSASSSRTAFNAATFGSSPGLSRTAARPHSSLSSSRASMVGGKSDVVIVGGGVMGLNIAYQLRRRDPSLSVTVLERAAALGFGSSGYSTGFQRA